MTKRNEYTSARIAKIAGRVMKAKSLLNSARLYIEIAGAMEPLVFTFGDIRALAASALTQAPDKPAKPKPSAWVQRRGLKRVKSKKA